MFARHSGRYLLIAVAVGLTLLGVAILREGLWWIAPIAFVPVFLFFLYFFRDPERTPGAHIVSPADGKVLAVEQSMDGDRLTIFMTPWSVHVNRAPADGRIARTEYRRGGHVPAFKKESERNERFDLQIEGQGGPFEVALIAGTVARRIHPYVESGAEVKKGDRIGLIAFGSRCELFLPPSRYDWVVSPGQWVKAGETTVARAR